MTYLHLAINADDLESVQFLIQVGANVNTQVADATKRTPLALAVTRGSVPITSALLGAGADARVTDVNNRWSVLHVAASLGFVNIVELLLRAGCEVNVVDDRNETPLHAAIRAGQALSAEKIIAFGNTNVNAANNQGQLPLHFLGLFARDNAVSIFQMLSRRISDVNPKDLDGNTPLFYAYANAAAPLCKALVTAGAHLALPNKQSLCCFDVEAPTKKLLYTMISAINAEPIWIEELPACQGCQAKFSVANRKHHW